MKYAIVLPDGAAAIAATVKTSPIRFIICSPCT